MKKILIRIALGLFVLIILAVVGLYFSLGSIVKKGVETVGPQVTKVDTTVGGATVSPFSGAGGIKKLHFGNPTGYQTSSAIDVGEARLSLQVGSLMSQKIIVREVIVDQPVITFEGSLQGKNNLSDILKNIDDFTATEEKQTTAAASPKLQVDKLVLKGAMIKVSMDFMRGRTVTLPMPDLQMEAMGTGPEGITVGELSKRVLKYVLENATTTISKSMGELTKEVSGQVKDLGKETLDNVNKKTEGVRDLFKRK